MLWESFLSADLILWPDIEFTHRPQEMNISNTVLEQRGEVLASGCTASE